MLGEAEWLAYCGSVILSFFDFYPLCFWKLTVYSCIFVFRRCEIQAIHLATQNDNGLLLGHRQLDRRVFCYNVLSKNSSVLFYFAYMAYLKHQCIVF